MPRGHNEQENRNGLGIYRLVSIFPKFQFGGGGGGEVLSIQLLCAQYEQNINVMPHPAQVRVGGGTGWGLTQQIHYPRDTFFFSNSLLFYQPLQVVICILLLNFVQPQTDREKQHCGPQTPTCTGMEMVHNTSHAHAVDKFTRGQNFHPWNCVKSPTNPALTQTCGGWAIKLIATQLLVT